MRNLDGSRSTPTAIAFADTAPAVQIPGLVRQGIRAFGKVILRVGARISELLARKMSASHRPEYEGWFLDSAIGADMGRRVCQETVYLMLRGLIT
jgi:hypothetical protein